jgi:hypothetical protein
MPSLQLSELNRRVFLTNAMLLPLSACALPVNHALGDWARTASVAIDDPPMALPSDRLRALQIALARYFFSIGILADHGVLVPPDDGAALIAFMDDVGPAAEPDARALDDSLQAAMRATPRPPATPPAPDAPAPPPDDRLRETLHAADRHVQALLATLVRSSAAPEPPCPANRVPASSNATRKLYGQTLERIGEGHARLTAQGSHVDEQQSHRLMDNENLELRRLLLRRSTAVSVMPDGCKGASGPQSAP